MPALSDNSVSNDLDQEPTWLTSMGRSEAAIVADSDKSACKAVASLSVMLAKRIFSK